LWYEEVGNDYVFTCRLRIREDAGEDCDGAILHEEDFDLTFSKFTDECQQVQYYAGPELPEWFGDFYLNLANYEDGCIPGSYEEDTCPICCPCPESIDVQFRVMEYYYYGSGSGWWYHNDIEEHVVDATVSTDANGNRLYNIDFTKITNREDPFKACYQSRGDNHIDSWERRIAASANDGVSLINSCENDRVSTVQFNYLASQWWREGIWVPGPPPSPNNPIKRTLYGGGTTLPIGPNDGVNDHAQVKCTQTYGQHGLGGIKDPGEPWNQVCGPQDTTECGPSFQNKICFSPERYSAPYVTWEMPGCNIPMFPLTSHAYQDNGLPGAGSHDIQALGGGEQNGGTADECAAPDANICCPESAPAGFQLWPGCAPILPKSAARLDFVGGRWLGQPTLYLDWVPFIFPGYIDLGPLFAYQGGFIENHPDNPNNYASLYWKIKSGGGGYFFDPCTEFDVFGRCTVTFDYTVQQRATRYDGSGNGTIIPGSNTYVDIGTFPCTIKWE
jgi:hypothetical protein